MQFENELISFVTNIRQYEEYIREHWNRDYHLGVENDDMLFLESMYRNFKFLTNYFALAWDIPRFSTLLEKSKEKFGDTGYELHEHDVAEIVRLLEIKGTQIIKSMKAFIEGEFSYWLITNRTLLNAINNLPDSYFND
jgi:hypothetical protein